MSRIRPSLGKMGPTSPTSPSPKSGAPQTLGAPVVSPLGSSDLQHASGLHPTVTVNIPLPQHWQWPYAHGRTLQQRKRALIGDYNLRSQALCPPALSFPSHRQQTLSGEYSQAISRARPKTVSLSVQTGELFIFPSWFHP